MRRIVELVSCIVLLAAALVACGGSGEPAADAPQQAIASLRVQARALAQRAEAAPAIPPQEAARQLMDFGEAQFPAYFPGHPATQSLPPFVFRHYPQTGAYLGVAVTAGLGYELLGVYVMGGPFGAEPQFVGPLAQFIEPVAAPAVRITQQPDDRVVDRGATAEFSVAAAGTAPLAYQWYRDGHPIGGATADRLRLQAVGAGDRGVYSVQVRDANGQAATSNRVALIVREAVAVPAAIGDILRRQNCLACHDTQRRIVGPSWTAIAQRYAGHSAQEAVLVQRMQQGGQGAWGLVPMPATGISGPDALAVARWLIAGEVLAGGGTAPSIAALPATMTADVGGSVRLTAAAQGTPPLTYQWRRDGVDIDGADAATLDLAPVSVADNERTYTVIVRNAAGSSRASTVLRVVHPADYPSAPIDIVVPAAAGGSLDNVARALATVLRERLRGTPVNVVNLGGNDGLEAFDRLLARPPNGYTLLLAGTGLAIAPALYPERALDPLRDLAPLGLLGHQPHLLAGGPQLPAGGAADLLAWWTGRTPAPIFAHTGIGQLSHLCGLMLADRTGLPLAPKAFQGAAPLTVDLIARRADLACLPAPVLQTAVLRNQVRAFAVTGAERSIVPALSGIETLDRSGLPGFELSDWYGLVARSGTAPVVLQRLEEALAAVRTDAYFMRQLTQHGVHQVTGPLATPDGHRAHLSAELDRWRALVARHGLGGN